VQERFKFKIGAHFEIEESPLRKERMSSANHIKGVKPEFL
jgi:hypothetical protein